MVVAMIEKLEEVEDLWSKVTRTAREQGPDDPRDGTVLKDWANVVSIKRVVDETLAASDHYHFTSQTRVRRKPTMVYQAGSMKAMTRL